MLRSEVVDELTICLYTIGGFPEIGNEIQDINFFHRSTFSTGFNARLSGGLPEAASKKLKAERGFHSGLKLNAERKKKSWKETAQNLWWISMNFR
jgi:hypothetical protein